MEISITEKINIITKVHCALDGTSPKGVVRSFSTPPRESHGFVFILSGKALYHTKSAGDLLATAGKILYLAKGERYFFEVLTNDYTYVFSNFEFEEKTLKRSALLNVKNLEEYKRLFGLLRRSLSSESPTSSLKAVSVLNRIYADLVDGYASYLPTSSAQKLAPALSYLADNFSSPDITVPFLSELCDMSEVHFRRIFLATLGVSPVKYLTSLRMNKAKILLSLRENTVTQIAEACGYSDVYYFSKAFKRHFGVSPVAAQKNPF